MKTTWIPLSLTAAILSGCTGMMYGGGVAPVANQNYYSGNRPAVVQQPYNPQPMRPVVAQSVRPYQPSAQVVNQPVTQTVTRQPMVPPSARPPQEVAQQAVNTGTQAVSPSPYDTPKVTKPTTASANDGWSVKPATSSNQPPTATDTPKLPGDAAATTPPASDTTAPATTTTQKEVVKPLRPPQTNDTQTNAEPNTQELATQNNEPTKKVAKNTTTASGGAVSTLLKKANGELGKGNLDGAAAYLEDAQRIDSKNSKILYDIANIRYHQGRYREAEAAAARAVNTGGSSAMMKKSWTLIANARKALGDNQGAIQAAEKASSL